MAARQITIEGQPFLRRSPLASWGLVFLTLGIYGFVWYYKINDEARRFLRDDTIKPGIAVLAVTLGVLILVPPFISYYRTGERIARMETHAQLANPVSPALGLLAALVMAVHVLYLQEHLNRVWDRYVPPQQPVQSPPPPPT